MKKLIISAALLSLPGTALAESTGKAFVLPSGWILILAILALIVAFAVVGSMTSKLKTAAHRSTASGYAEDNKLRLRVNKDHFLYETTTKKKIEQKQ